MKKKNKDYIFNKLYKDAEKLRMKKVILSNEIYSDKHGITFQPKVNNNPKYYVESNFEEREQNHIINRQIKIRRMIKERYEQSPFHGNKSRTLSKEERDNNTKNIVDRLYNRQIAKLKEYKEKKIEEDKKAEKELKKREKSKDEIEINNKKIIERLYSTQIEKVKEKYHFIKKPKKEDVEKQIEILESQNINKIKKNNKRKFSNIHSKVYNNHANKTNNKDQNSLSPTNNNNENLLKKLKKEHKIKFKDNPLNRISKSKSKNRNFFEKENKAYNNEMIIKKTEDDIMIGKGNSLMVSRSSDKRDSALRKSIGKNSSNDFYKKNTADYLLELNNIHLKTTERAGSLINSQSSKEKITYSHLESNEINNNKGILKKKSTIKDDKDIMSILKNVKSDIYKDSRPSISKQDNLKESIDSDNNKNNTLTGNNSTPFKDTSITNNSYIKANKHDNSIIKEIVSNNIENNNDYPRGENKENKFRSKGLEKILNSRK